ncbi:MAG: PAS domain-containing protein [Marinilabiliaceae bacterium]|nr:PAS domain-containing protein [Marinilabiliaceae bacterium]
MRLFTRGWFIFFIFFTCIFISKGNESYFNTKQKILLLNSYHKGFKWTDDITEEVQKHFHNNDNYSLFIEFMDSKRFQDSSYFKALAKLYIKKYNSIKFNGIICSDNNALDFIIEYGDSIWGKPPIVFCGINNPLNYRNIDTTRIFGVNEQIDFKSTIKCAITIQPNLNEFIIIGDKTRSFTIFYQQFLEAIKSYNGKISHRLFIVTDTHSLKKLLSKINPSHKAIYLLSLYINKNGSTNEMAKEAYDIFSKFKIPVYGNWDFLFPNLIIGGKIIKGSNQGKLASELMIKKIHSPHISIPYISSCKQEWVFDQQLLEKFNINKKLLPPNSQIVNNESSFLFKYKKEGSIVIGVIIFLIIIILLLISNTIQRRKAELELLVSENRLELALEGAKQGLWDVNINNKTFYVNQQFASLLGYSNPQDMNISLSNWENFFYADDMDHLKETLYLHNIKKLDSINCEVRLIKKSKDFEWFAIHGKITENDKDKPIRITGSILNINNQKTFESELLNAKNKAEESDRLKSSFLANMSHEIRTPMNAILGFADIVTSDLVNQKERNSYLSLIKKSGESLLTLINDIIDISKIESGQLVITPEVFNLNNLLTHIEKITNTLIANSEKNIHFIIKKDTKNEDLLITADPHRLEQILLNLITNSIKFTSTGFIELEYIIENKNTLTFNIKDSGIGISDEHKKIIFERFRQADESTAKKFGGTGLGLAICNSLIKMMGGNISVDSTPGMGSNFSFKIETKFINFDFLNEDQSLYNQN